MRSQPFGLSPGVEHLYLGQQHGEALAGLQLGIRQRRGLITLIGEVGMGKTTLAHAVIRQMSERVMIGYTATTTLSFQEMMKPVLKGLGIVEGADGKAETIWQLTELLKIADRRGRIVALIVDEAHNLGEEAFEELRQLLNIETEHAKLLQLVLIGQPELSDRLADPRLRHLADRVAVRCVLNPLSRKEALDYLGTRLLGAGGSPDLFTKGALRAILREAQGVPRSLNVLCHNALLFAFGDASRRVEPRHARTAIVERRGGHLVRLDRKRQPGLWPVAAGLLVGGVVIGILIGVATRPPPSGSPEMADAFRSPTAAGGLEQDGSDPTPADPDPAESAGSRVVVVQRGSNLSREILSAYGVVDRELLDLVLRANPGITDPELVPTGYRLVLPARPGER
ncbi:MAG TPA: AAA family ATPase [Thermoanaerobaculia bacterium]|nr:AAA family ATPase [Thermoanaerobaculia bacterium]